MHQTQTAQTRPSCLKRIPGAITLAALLAATVIGAAQQLVYARPPAAHKLEQAGRKAQHDAIAIGANAFNAVSSTNYLPSLLNQRASPTPPPPPTQGGEEWSQHGHDAQRTSYTDQVVNTPWRWKWSWNGSNSSGGVAKATASGSLPRNVQPVTGGGRVYVAAGSDGVFALSEVNGQQVWKRNPGGSINSTVAYDKDTQTVFVVSSNGTLYKLNASNGDTAGQFPGDGTSTLPLPPAVIGDRVFFSMGNRVLAVNKNTMQQVWAYDAGAAVHTPPAYSASRNRVVVASEDLNVHAINNTDGSRAWRVRPVAPGLSNNASQSDGYAEYKNGWPVIADAAGYALIKARLDWQTMFVWNPWPTSNVQMRSNLINRPDQQALFVLDLDDGAKPFIANVGHGGYGDGGVMPMGPQPVVKRLSNGKDVVYTVIRGHPSNDGRWDSAFGEMMLDDSTVSGYKAGEVRFIRYDNPPGAGAPYLLTDEQPNVSMAGDYLFGGHWMTGLSLRITDRSAKLGQYGQPIAATNAPPVVTAQAPSAGCAFSASHYCPQGLLQDVDPRVFTPGFYIYYGQGKVYDRYWSEYAGWVVSNNALYFRSNDGAIVALQGGNPQAVAGQSQAFIGPLHGASVEDASSGTLATAAAVQLDYSDARAYAGVVATVEGEVAYIFNNGKQVLYGFTNPHQGAFKILVTKEHWKHFGAVPEDYLHLGQRVRVTGKITWYQGDPVMYVYDPIQIQAGAIKLAARQERLQQT